MASSLTTPEEAADRVAAFADREPRLRVAGVAGPGEPIANPETFTLFRLLRRRLPQLTLCVSTNGLLLPEKIDELCRCGVQALTITINAVGPDAAAQLYTQVRWNDTLLLPEEGIPFLLEQQQRGLRLAVQAGLAVKVNTVLVPGINQDEVPRIAKLAREAGAAVMNITPLIPCGLLSRATPPTPELLSAARRAAAVWLPQFTLCKQCRADACGVPGVDWQRYSHHS